MVSCGTFGVFFVAGLGGDAEVVAGVRVDDYTKGTELLGTLDFETAEDATVSGDYDGSFDADIVGKKGLVVGECAIVDEDEWASDVPTERGG